MEYLDGVSSSVTPLSPPPVFPSSSLIMHVLVWTECMLSVPGKVDKESTLQIHCNQLIINGLTLCLTTIWYLAGREYGGLLVYRGEPQQTWLRRKPLGSAWLGACCMDLSCLQHLCLLLLYSTLKLRCVNGEFLQWTSLLGNDCWFVDHWHHWKALPSVAFWALAGFGVLSLAWRICVCLLRWLYLVSCFDGVFWSVSCRL